MLRRFTASAAVGTGLVLALTGCLGGGEEKAAGGGGGDAKLTASQALGQAAEKAGQVDTFAAQIDMNTPTPQGAVQMKMALQAKLRPEVAMNMKVDSMKMASQQVPGYEMVMNEKAAYMKMPALSQANGGKPWTRFSLDQLGATAGMNMQELIGQARQQSPAEQTKMLTASKDAKNLGTENVGGVETTHYKGTLPVSEALGKLEGEARAAAEKAFQQLGAQTINFDVWVDKDGLPRKHVSVFDTNSGRSTTTALYSDYGKPVQVTEPPAAEVGTVKLPNS
ncbi:LppX_LprAFG lipoprotein [Actinomadura flavalba]|uniref:LppX_LprAFG lipoprotein n=1 Tax=Actinomadura flavalba TaxID=1120938 RepID=UPI00036A8BFB|nr:LppX_LprAFG lipoprotein [Actinomadura flavalba]